MPKNFNSLTQFETAFHRRERFLKYLIVGNLEEIKKIGEKDDFRENLELLSPAQEWYFLLWATQGGHIPVINYLAQKFHIASKIEAGEKIKQIITIVSPERIELYEYFFRLLADIGEYEHLKLSLNTNNIENSPQKEKIKQMALSLVEKQVFEEHIHKLLGVETPVNPEQKRNIQKI